MAKQVAKIAIGDQTPRGGGSGGHLHAKSPVGAVELLDTSNMPPPSADAAVSVSVAWQLSIVDNYVPGGPETEAGDDSASEASASRASEASTNPAPPIMHDPDPMTAACPFCAAESMVPLTHRAISHTRCPECHRHFGIRMHNPNAPRRPRK